MEHTYIRFVVVVRLLSPVWFFVTRWTAACQAFLSFTNSWNLLKFRSIESVMPSNHFILCHPLLLLLSILPSTRIFSNGLFASGGQSSGGPASATVFPMNSQGWFSLGLTGLISFLPKGLSRVLNLYIKPGINSFNNLNTPQNIWNDE